MSKKSWINVRRNYQKEQIGDEGGRRLLYETAGRGYLYQSWTRREKKMTGGLKNPARLPKGLQAIVNCKKEEDIGPLPNPRYLKGGTLWWGDGGIPLTFGALSHGKTI